MDRRGAAWCRSSQDDANVDAQHIVTAIATTPFDSSFDVCGSRLIPGYLYELRRARHRCRSGRRSRSRRGCMSSRTDVAAAPSFLKGCWRLRANSRREMPSIVRTRLARRGHCFPRAELPRQHARIPRRYCVAIRRRKRALSLTRPCCSRSTWNENSRRSVSHCRSRRVHRRCYCTHTAISAMGIAPAARGPALTHSRGHSTELDAGCCGMVILRLHTRTLRRLACDRRAEAVPRGACFACRCPCRRRRADIRWRTSRMCSLYILRYCCAHC